MHSDATVISLSELCEATGASPSRIEFLIRLGAVVPAKTGHGRGSYRHYTVENILEISLAEELTKARFSGYQLQKVATTLRTAIAHLSLAERIVERFRHFISTVERLAAIFGKVDGYDAWRKLQVQQLQRMERTLSKPGNEARLDTRLCKLFVAAKSADDEPSALAG